MIDLQRVKRILMSPKAEWPAIASEPATVGGVVRDYLVWLAGAAAIARFIEMSIFGMGAFGVTVRLGVGAGLGQALMHFVLTLVMAWVMSLIVNWLAPKFGGTADPVAAFKLVAYATTASLVGSIVSILPWLGIVAMIGGLYSLYLVYVGLPVLMKNPPERTLPYAALVIVCGMLAGVVIGWITGIGAHRGGMMMGGAGAPEVTVRTPRGEVTVPSSKVEDLGRRFEEMGKRIEEAKKSGDPEAVAKATREGLASIASGTGGRKPLEPSALKAMLPETLAGLARRSYESEMQSVAGLSVSGAKALYQDGDRTLRVEVSDMGAAAGLMSLVGWANVVVDKESDTAIEKTFKEGRRTINERAQKDGSSARLRVLLINGIVVDLDGRRMALADLRRVAGSLDLDKLEAMK